MTLEHFDTILAFVTILAGVSLLVTTLVQAASALLGLRGTNLRWGLETLLKNADPALTAHARDIANQVLHHPLISDSSCSKFSNVFVRRWKLASTIRKAELPRILELLAQPTRPGSVNASLGTEPPSPQGTAAPPAADGSRDAKGGWQAALATSLETLTRDAGDHILRLFTQLSSDAVLRERVVGSADALIQKAEEIPLSATNVNPAAYGAAMRLLVAAHTNEFQGVKPPASLGSLEAGSQWLTNQAQTLSLTNLASLVMEYETLVPQAAFRTAADNLRTLIEEKLQLDLLPDTNPDWVTWSGRTPLPTAHFWGVTVSAVLLSLGAPFWFNLLKLLTNLRPVPATKAQKESEQRDAAAGDSASGSGS